jgi:hypothetical protein
VSEQLWLIQAEIWTKASFMCDVFPRGSLVQLSVLIADIK